MIKAVIFDLNGVFLKSEYLSKRVEEKYGISGDAYYSELKKVLDITRKPNAGDFFELLSPDLEKLGLSISKDEFFSFWFSGEELVPELIEYTKELRKKEIKIFILSNNFKERTEYYRQNFPEVFNGANKVYFSWETGFVKPDPQAYKNILNQHDLRPEECAYFDDSEENIEIAKSLGIHAQKYQGLEKTKEFMSKFLNKT